MEQISIAGSSGRMFEISEPIDCLNVAASYVALKVPEDDRNDDQYHQAKPFRPGGFRETIRDLMLAGF